MKTNVILFSFIIVLIISCRDNRKLNKGNKTYELGNKSFDKITSTIKSEELLTVNIDSIQCRRYLSSEIFRSIKYVPLETTEESIIGRIAHIEIVKDTLYILDSSSSKSLFIFSLNGKFIRKIGEVGRGPGEYIEPSDFTIDELNNEIYIIDAYLQKINIYSTDGKFLRQIVYKSEVRSNYLEFKDGQLFLDARKPKGAGFKYLVRRINNSGIEIDRWFKVPEYNKGWDTPFYIGGSQTFYSAPKDIKYVELFMDTIFSITNSGIKPFITLKTKYRLTGEKLAEIKKNNPDANLRIHLYLLRENCLWNIHNYIENEDIIFFSYRLKSSIYSVIVEKNSRNLYHISAVKDDLTFPDLGPIVFLKLFSGSKNFIIGEVDNIQKFQSNIVSNKTALLVSERQAILKLDPTVCNPILILIGTK